MRGLVRSRASFYSISKCLRGSFLSILLRRGLSIIQLFNFLNNNLCHSSHQRDHNRIAKLLIGLSITHDYLECIWKSLKPCTFSRCETTRDLPLPSIDKDFGTALIVPGTESTGNTMKTA